MHAKAGLIVAHSYGLLEQAWAPLPWGRPLTLSPVTQWSTLVSGVFIKALADKNLTERWHKFTP